MSNPRDDPIFDKAEDLDKHARQTRYEHEGRG